jgi:integrase
MQLGSVLRETRKNGPGVWQFRWSEKTANGRRVYRKRVIGTVDQYADEAAVRHAASGLLSEVNARSSLEHQRPISIDQLCEHLEQREL